jgi:putative peptide zinc metalloprotease protein
LAENTTNGGVLYDVAYALVTVGDGAPVTNTNSAYAIAHCRACTTVAVSFQLVLIIGQSKVIAPINAAGALNYQCPACMTTALADQIVVTLKSQPSQQLLATLNADLQQLNALPALGAGGTPAAVATQVAAVQQEIDSALQASGLETNPPASNSTSTTGTSFTTTPSTSATTTTSSATTPTGSTSTSATGSSTSTTSSGTSSTGSGTSTSTGTTPSTSSTTSTTASPGAAAPSETTSTATSTTPGG